MMKYCFSTYLTLAFLSACLLIAGSACSKQMQERQEGGADSIIDNEGQSGDEQQPEGPQKPSKYKPEELITVTFTADSEATKTSLADNGRSVVWTLNDEVLFVWGPDEEDRRIGIATEISEDGKRATFTVEAYEGAQAIYAVYPAAAFSSFEKLPAYDTDGSGTVRVSVGAMADGTRTNGTFGQADVCIGRSSLESGKMKFKHLVAFVTMTATQPATARVRLDGLDLVNVGGTLPVTVGVGEDGFTGTPSLGSLENPVTSVTVDAAGVDGSTKTWIPVIPNMSFAGGIQLSFLDVNDQVIGQATLRKSTTVALGYELTFPATLNTQFAKDFYVKANADGSGDGSSWDSPWTAAQMADYLGTAHSETGLSSDATLNFHIAAGEYSQSFNVASQTLKDGTTARRINVICGYPSTITNANAASNPPDPANNTTTFSGSTIAAGNSIWKCTKTNTFFFSGMTVSGYAGESTNDVAFALYENDGQTVQASFTDCIFSDNDNTGGAETHVGAAVSVYDGAEASFTRCTFSGNLASAGAALNIDYNAVVALDDCTFSENQVAVHQSNNAQDCGGAVKVCNGTLTLNNCDFLSNGVEEAATIGYGGALWVDQTLTTTVTINGGSFVGNYVANATGKGGAVFLQGGTLNLNDVEFSANACTAAATTTGGGAVFIGYDTHKPGRNVTLNVTGCEFDGNILADRGDDKNSSVGGGAFYIEPDAGKTVTCSFTGTTFSNHILNDIYGGVFYAKGGTLRFYGCTFTGNDIRWTYEKANPGSLQRQAVGSVVYNEGAVCYFDDDASGNKTRFISNAGYKGGCLCIDSSTSASYTLDDCIFQENITTASGGSCVRVGADNGQVLTIRNCTFSDNESGGSGGAVAVYKNNETTISGCTFEDNTSEGFGGAVYIAGETSFAVATVAPVTISDCTFNRNVANGGGGAIEVSNAGCDAAGLSSKSDIDIVRCTFSGNHSAAYGGAVGIRSFGTSLVKDCIFTGNYTTNTAGTGRGGALSFRDGNKSDYTDPAHPTVSGCTFIGNYTSCSDNADGGAVQVNSYGTSGACVEFRMDKCAFQGNYANRGGALRFYCSDSGTYRYFINDCVFDGNYITGNYGTTLRADGNTTGGTLHLCMNNCTIHDTWSDSSWTGKWACWVDILNVSGVFSNNTLIGQTQRSSGDTGTSSKNTGANNFSALMRLDYYTSASYDLYFINNIIAPTQDWVYSIIQSRPEGGTSYDLGTRFYANKMGPTVPYVDESTTGQVVAITNDASDDGLNSFGYYGNSSYFGDLAWCTDSPLSRTNSYWYWNGTAATGSPTGKISIGTLAARISSADSDFYDWLNTPGIDGIYKDQRGAIRTSPVATGAYDPGNAGQVSDDTAEDANRGVVTLTN